MLISNPFSLFLAYTSGNRNFFVIPFLTHISPIFHTIYVPPFCNLYPAYIMNQFKIEITYTYMKFKWLFILEIDAF